MARGRPALAALLLASSSVPAVLAAQTPEIRGAWNAERYIMREGAEHRVEGRIFFTESDWQVVFFVVDGQGEVKRASAEGGTYTLEGNDLTFAHLHNFSTGEAMEGLEAAPLRMVYRELEDAPLEPSAVFVDGDELTLEFPSGNQLIFTRSSGTPPPSADLPYESPEPVALADWHKRLSR